MLVPQRSEPPVERHAFFTEVAALPDCEQHSASPRPRNAADARQDVAGRHPAWPTYAILHRNLVNQEDRREPYEHVD